ncbi:hypothetical protein [Desulfosporosinus sp. Sb-LF]|uniref:hypothetical protein n=1 Tax=Desulfosporosinus sp. Sb-LF TaxID=2560027 RepID=UPI00107F7EDA|nr:hypothetical protein [Desulfosporosinus sp. Sb-LF]TGE31879.1 hypothetical protein E4K68_14385 [Desulfosporosinus sp. Sb-LF]
MAKIIVRYLGATRLMVKRKMDELEFPEEAVRLKTLFNRLEEILGPAIVQDMLSSQVVVISPSPGEPGRILERPTDLETMLPPSCCITLVTPVAGG